MEYKVILKGLRPGVNRRIAVERMAELFKFDSDKMEALLSRCPAVVKRVADEPTARKYRSVIVRAGGDCVVEIVGSAPMPPVEGKRGGQPAPKPPQRRAADTSGHPSSRPGPKPKVQEPSKKRRIVAQVVGFIAGGVLGGLLANLLAGLFNLSYGWKTVLYFVFGLGLWKVITEGIMEFGKPAPQAPPKEPGQPRTDPETDMAIKILALGGVIGALLLGIAIGYCVRVYYGLNWWATVAYGIFGGIGSGFGVVAVLAFPFVISKMTMDEWMSPWLLAAIGLGYILPQFLLMWVYHFDTWKTFVYPLGSGLLVFGLGMAVAAPFVRAKKGSGK